MLAYNYATWNMSYSYSAICGVNRLSTRSTCSENVNSYDGVTKSLGYRAYRNFKDIEPNRSVRPGFTSMDYHAFRPDEQVPREQKRMIKMCMDAYSKVGIIRNIIDLMGDFGSQGINVVHPNKSAEKFLWMALINYLASIALSLRVLFMRFLIYHHYLVKNLPLVLLLMI